ncbi:Arm DNA-binding domain-containing protein [Undibacterium arcticum]
MTDGGGLHLLVKPDGAKYWRMGYRFAGVERTLAFGKVPRCFIGRRQESKIGGA